MTVIYYVAELLYFMHCAFIFLTGGLWGIILYKAALEHYSFWKALYKINTSKAYSETNTRIECLGICSFNIIHTAVSKSGEENDWLLWPHFL